MKRSRIFVCLLILSALALAACGGPSRSASTPVTVPGETQTGGEAQPTDDGTGGNAPEQLATVMAGELATQTAVAGGGGEFVPSEPTDAAAPTDAPVVEPTAEPPTAEPPTPTPEPPTATSAPAVDCSSPYTVKAGDWVWNIGRRCNIHPDSIIAANNLRWPYTLYPGDILTLPSNAPPFPPE